MNCCTRRTQVPRKRCTASMACHHGRRRAIRGGSSACRTPGQASSFPKQSSQGRPVAEKEGRGAKQAIIVQRLHDGHLRFICRRIDRRRNQRERIVAVQHLRPLLPDQLADLLEGPPIPERRPGGLPAAHVFNVVIVAGIADHLVATRFQQPALVGKDLVFAARLAIEIVAQQDSHRISFSGAVAALIVARLLVVNQTPSPRCRLMDCFTLAAQVYQPSSFATSVAAVSHGNALKRPHSNGSLPDSISEHSVVNPQFAPLSFAAATISGPAKPECLRPEGKGEHDIAQTERVRRKSTEICTSSRKRSGRPRMSRCVWVWAPKSINPLSGISRHCSIVSGR